MKSRAINNFGDARGGAPFLNSSNNNKDYNHLNVFNIKKDVIHALEILPRTDRDLRSLTIFLNPNYRYGADSDLRNVIKNILKSFVNTKILQKETAKVANTEYEVYTLEENVVLFSN